MTKGDSIRNEVETIVKTNPAFALTTEIIRGLEYRVFKNAPATIRDLIEACRKTHNSHVDDYLVFPNDRWSYNGLCSAIASVAGTAKQEFDKKHTRLACHA